MIVKVQISQFGSEGRKMALIYDQTRKHRLEIEADEKLLKLMGDSPKKYFHATIEPHPKNWLQGEKVFELGKEASWQNW